MDDLEEKINRLLVSVADLLGEARPRCDWVEPDDEWLVPAESMRRVARDLGEVVQLKINGR